MAQAMHGPAKQVQQYPALQACCWSVLLALWPLDSHLMHTHQLLRLRTPPRFVPCSSGLSHRARWARAAALAALQADPWAARGIDRLPLEAARRHRYNPASTAWVVDTGGGRLRGPAVLGPAVAVTKYRVPMHSACPRLSVSQADRRLFFPPTPNLANPSPALLLRPCMQCW